MLEPFIEKLKYESFLSLETTPIHEPTFEPMIEKIAHFGLDKHVDGFSTTDNPLARLKYNALFGALKLQNRFNKPVIATMSMRDRNKLALQSDLLGANENDLRAILCLTGDPSSASDQPSLKGVFEGNSTLLMDIIQCFNAGMDYSGKPFKTQPHPIYPFAVCNAHSNTPRHLMKKIATKISHGAVGIISQPVYSVDNASMLLELLKEAKKELGKEDNEAQMILGFFPIVKLRTAQFLSAHVPGVNVPNFWMEKLARAKKISEEEEKKVGFELSLQTFHALKKVHPKIHMMSANNFELVADLLKA
ncbi:methylenetetrahydrofolate reductase [Sulfurospirillum barnesii]|uniref:Methylenetetrahydrofolate reductase n=1 Tax=Sulfurospirillum barnesii (strain ATCC 700032 / DSM 10660 / SES-3) TaxID=760154 RepID=I3XUC8_SULBS|nr:methylenetetrahydrofolate reductase [Sulfurospirillum barnesii]AFL67552.1 5,10-methylenetetrahydrofolate reductase [Sulfurospirillum barnesii SES-3]